MADHSDDLDQLLDRALDDFQSLTFASSAQRGVENNGDRNEENKQECCTLNGGNVQGLGMGLPDLKIKKKGKTKMPPPKQESHITEALDKLMEQTREAVKGLESVSGPRPPVAGDDSGGDAMTEDWVKQFEELAGSQDMESIVESMMQQLLSKEILHEPMKEIGERYPTWLEDNRAKLTAEEYSRYSRQYRLIKDLNQVYESEPENSTRLLSLCSKCKSVVNHQMILCKRLLQILIYQILDNCLQRCWSLNRIVVLCDVREKPWFYFSKGGFCHSIILPVKEIELVKLS